MGDILSPISQSDCFALREMELLLRQEGIRRDANLDYSCGLYDEDENLVATGSCFGNTIRCLAVAGSRRGQGLLVRIVSHLMDIQAQRGNLHVFLYTKCANAAFFADLGFHEIVRVADQMVFMENRRNGFRQYCDGLQKKPGERIAAVVMNANPFTLGHRHLLEQACKENDVVHLFLLGEDTGPIPSSVRRRLVQAGIADLPNVILQDSGPYIISTATFPSYFLKDEDTRIQAHAELDLEVFSQIAASLGIQRRYVGEEPTSRVTGLYNKVMAAKLSDYGIECRIVPRMEADGSVISASTVRQAIHDGNLDSVKNMLPDSIYRYFSSPDSESVRASICRQEELIHY